MTDGPHSPTDNIAFYDQQVDELDTLYSTSSFADIHQHWFSLVSPSLPKSAHTLDVGAGNGRDAAGLLAQGHRVVAVEPSHALRNKGKLRAPQAQWCDDTLPALATFHDVGQIFDLILLSAVWMHLPKRDIPTALQTLAALTKPGGHLVITLRHGDFNDGRSTDHPDIETLRGHFDRYGLTETAYLHNDDTFSRQAVSWSTVILMKR